jgi:hypothetical protein
MRGHDSRLRSGKDRACEELDWLLDFPFFDALTAMLGKNAVDVQGIDYSASIEGLLEGGDAQGSQTM